MNTGLQFHDAPPGSLRIGRDGGPTLWHYVFAPDTPSTESPRPFAHPVYSPEGDVLTNWRPNDHPWHHGLSFTLTSVNGVNFWGGPSHRAADGYQWREDQGSQHHVDWVERTPDRLVERLEWRHGAGGQDVMLQEERLLTTELVEGGWKLGWTSRLRNPGQTDLTCHNYHSLGGLAGSHYSGLQFRGARGLLDQHGDDQIGVRGESGGTQPDTLHGESASWLEWHFQSDQSLRRGRIRFQSLRGPIPWFLRPENPLVAFAPHREQPLILSAGQTVEFAHELHFLRA